MIKTYTIGRLKIVNKNYCFVAFLFTNVIYSDSREFIVLLVKLELLEIDYQYENRTTFISIHEAVIIITGTIFTSMTMIIISFICYNGSHLSI